MFPRQILIAEDEPLLQRSLYESFKRHGFKIYLAADGKETLEMFRKNPTKLVIADMELPYVDGIKLLEGIKALSPDTYVILTTACGSIEKAVEVLKIGAYDYIEKPFSKNRIDNLVENVLKSNPSNSYGPLFDKKQYSEIVTQSPKMLKLMEMAKNIAKTRATVLLEGESGTGKELMANYIHSHSEKNKSHFLAINCAALPENLLESELFGHEKGSFTGAVSKRRGIFERSDKGTLFLDEIGEISMSLQAKLLRVLQERNFERLGGESLISVDVRIITSTNRNLALEVKNKKFREDLYYRINVIPLVLPPLREKKEDIPILINHFIDKYCKMNDLEIEGISGSALNYLMKYRWPGNVRELENTIERAVIIKMKGKLETEDFWLPFEEESSENFFLENLLPVHDLQKEYIVETLKRFNGNRTRTANALGLSVRTIRNRIREYRAQGIQL